MAQTRDTIDLVCIPSVPNIELEAAVLARRDPSTGAAAPGNVATLGRTSSGIDVEHPRRSRLRTVTVMVALCVSTVHPS